MGAVKPTKARSLGDIIFDNHLINVKFGTPTISAKDKRNKTLDNILYSTKITPNYGQPNMCSMKRIMKAFYKTSQIDSYYIIKVSVLPTSYSLHVFDMFDFIDYLTWNSGTGQIMLKENKFYQDIDTFVPNFTIQEKKDKLNNLYNSGSKDHILLRLKQYLDQSDDKQAFMNEVMSMFN
jgi:CRISPR/Cas system CMR-associated protein Cmr1 (group 7 of RAMP superfamily)